MPGDDKTKPKSNPTPAPAPLVPPGPAPDQVLPPEPETAEQDQEPEKSAQPRPNASKNKKDEKKDEDEHKYDEMLNDANKVFDANWELHKTGAKALFTGGSSNKQSEEEDEEEEDQNEDQQPDLSTDTPGTTPVPASNPATPLNPMLVAASSDLSEDAENKAGDDISYENQESITNGSGQQQQGTPSTTPSPEDLENLGNLATKVATVVG